VYASFDTWFNLDLRQELNLTQKYPIKDKSKYASTGFYDSSKQCFVTNQLEKS
jgi:hypothetical protein